MIAHKRMQVPNIHMINEVEAQGTTFEKKGKFVNYCVFT